MDYAEAEYIARTPLRCERPLVVPDCGLVDEKQKLAARYPALGDRIQATSPDIEDTLTR